MLLTMITELTAYQMLFMNFQQIANSSIKSERAEQTVSLPYRLNVYGDNINFFGVFSHSNQTVACYLRCKFSNRYVSPPIYFLNNWMGLIKPMEQYSEHFLSDVFTSIIIWILITLIRLAHFFHQFLMLYRLLYSLCYRKN